MAKKRIKLSPAGILFLIAIAVLVIALVAVVVVLMTTCGSEREANRSNTSASASPSATDDLPVFDPNALQNSPGATDDPNANAEPNTEPGGTDDPNANAEPNEPVIPSTTDNSITGLTAIETPDPNANVVVNTPAAAATSASPSATTKVYKSPTSKQKKAAKSGYIYKDKVNMRKGPGKNYDIVKKELSKNTTVTLYELQDGWWFLKCGSSYGYIKKDYIKEGKPASTPKPTATPKSTAESKTYEGTIKTNSVAALRKSASKSSTCLEELKNGTKVTVYYKTKDKDGNLWYYVKYGSKKGYVKGALVSTSKKVPTK